MNPRPRGHDVEKLRGPLRALILMGIAKNPEGFARLLRWLAAAALALSLAGCGQRWAPGVTAGVDPGLDEFSLQVALWVGVEDWCFATNGAGCITLNSGSKAPAFVKGDRSDETGTAAAYLPSEGVVELDPASPYLDTRRRLAVIKHEIGHAFGIQHQTRGLMQGEPDGPWRRRVPGCIDAHTLAKFCELHPCALPVRPECED